MANSINKKEIEASDILEAKQQKMRKGMATFDLLLYMGLAAIALGVVIWLWTGLKTSMDSNALRDKALTVIAGVEKAKTDYNTGAYPVAATESLNAAAPSNDVRAIQLAMGGDQAVSSLTEWTYDCTEGSPETVTIVSETITDQDVLDGAVMAINDKFSDGWSAANTGNQLTLTRTNSVCKDLQ